MNHVKLRQNMDNRSMLMVMLFVLSFIYIFVSMVMLFVLSFVYIFAPMVMLFVLSFVCMFMGIMYGLDRGDVSECV